MQHFPVFIAIAGRRIVVSGAGECALAKLRLLMKTEGHITVFGEDAIPAVEALASKGALTLIRRPLEPGDSMCAKLFYAANDDEDEDARVAALAHADGALVNVVDNLAASAFITPAIVDRDPVTIAIGTEGAAPVLARAMKADLEARLPSSLGVLARIGKSFRSAVDALPMGRKRRAFWSDYYFSAGPEAMARDGRRGVPQALGDLLDHHIMAKAADAHVHFVGAGPGDPDLLTLKARKAIDTADVVIYDRLVTPEILELARREAIMVDMGKEGFGPSVTQDEINAQIIEHARDGAQVVRLKSGDPTVYGRLDEEIEAVAANDIPYSIVPGITAASAAVASIGQSLTKRGRNSSIRLLTGHDTRGFAEHDWAALAAPGEVAAIYMGKKSARFIQGRLLMHGADADTPVTIIENASRMNQRIIATTLGELEPTMSSSDITGPAITFYGLAPRDAAALAPTLSTQEAV